MQLVKLACAFVVETPFLLITDADTFFLRPMRGQDLVEAARCTASSAICDANGKVTLHLLPCNSDTFAPHSRTHTGMYTRTHAHVVTRQVLKHMEVGKCRCNTGPEMRCRQ